MTYIDHLANGVEEPPVRVDLLLILGFDAEDDLDRDKILLVVPVGLDELRGSVDRQLGGVLKCGLLVDATLASQTESHLEDMCDSVLAVNLLLHDTILIYANSSKDVQNALVHGVKSIANERDADLGPGGLAALHTALPILGLLRLANVSNVQHNAMERTSYIIVLRRDIYA